MLAAVGDGCRWVGWGSRGRAVASPGTLLAPGNSAEPDGQPWLYLDHSTLVQTTCQQSHLGAAGSHVSPAFCLPCHPHPQYTLSTPSAHPCHPYHPHPQTEGLSTPLKPTLSSPVWPHALLYKNPFPQFDEREGWNSSHTSIQI